MFSYTDHQLPSDPLRRGAVVIWTNMPILVVTGAAAAGLWSLGRATGLLLPIAFGGVMPLLTALTVGFDRLMAGEHFGLHSLARCVPRISLAAWRLLWPCTLAVATTAAANAVSRSSGQTWMLLSVGAGLTMSVCSAAVGLPALYIAAVAGGTARRAWKFAAGTLCRRPVGGFGTVAVFVLAGWVSQYLSFALLVLLPIPLLCLWIAAVKTAVADDELAALARNR